MVEVSNFQLWLGLVVSFGTSLVLWLYRHELKLNTQGDAIDSIKQRLFGHQDDSRDDGFAGETQDRLSHVEAEVTELRTDVARVDERVQEVGGKLDDLSDGLGNLTRIVTEETTVSVDSPSFPTDDD